MLLLGFITLILALLGAPLFVIIAANALIQYYFADIDFIATSIELYRLADMPLLLPIPLFTFAGYILANSKAPERLMKLSQNAFGWAPGGLSIVALVACALFTAFTGASGVTIIALGGLLFPALIKQGYQEKFSLGLITSSGSIGLLFPPSLPLIIYGVISSTSIDHLFKAGILPGILMVSILSVYSMISAKKQKIVKQEFSFQKLRESLWDARFEFPLPIIVLGGIYSGFFAISEAAALTTFIVIVVEVGIHREIKLAQLPHIMRQTLILVGSILIIMGCSMAYTNYLLDAEIPMKILDVLKHYIQSRFAFLLCLNIFLLIVGCMLDIFSALVVVVPLILPISQNYGIDPVHLGIIFLTNLNIGYLTPPVGLNLFIASIRFKKPIILLYFAALPFLIVLLITLILITYIPWLSLSFL